VDVNPKVNTERPEAACFVVGGWLDLLFGEISWSRFRVTFQRASRRPEVVLKALSSRCKTVQ